MRKKAGQERVPWRPDKRGLRLINSKGAPWRGEEQGLLDCASLGAFSDFD